MRNIDTTDCHIKFGQWIKSKREQQKLSQEEVASMLGTAQSYYSYLERGQRVIDLTMAVKLCTVLNVDMKEFLTEYFL